jgi:hypothetical protein
LAEKQVQVLKLYVTLYQIVLTYGLPLHRCQKWINNCRRKDVVPEAVYDALPPAKQTRMFSTKHMRLCEDHFAVEMYNCPADKGI